MKRRIVDDARLTESYRSRRGLVAWWLVLLGCASVSRAVAAGVTDHNLFQWRPFLAPFHAIVLHIPIGFITAACILELYALRRPSPELRRVTTMIIALSLLAGMITATFGLMRASTGGYDPKTLAVHRVFGLGVPLFTLLTLLAVGLAVRRGQPLVWMSAYRALLGATLALLVVAGHFGGNLTHGTEYLLKNAPRFVRDMLEHEAATAPSADVGHIFYREKVQPILSAKCYHCHGPEKQKGGYRLDDPQTALRGGESELTAIEPGNPAKSHLVELILLPPQDENVMPPKGKEPLTSEEIMILLGWIRDGALFGEQSRRTQVSVLSP
jgi:uncharacterized membrane protein